MPNYSTNIFHSYIGKYRKAVVWGLRRQYHTHRYIHAGFYGTLRKLNVPAVWVDYGGNAEKIIGKGDLVISAFVSGRGVTNPALPIRPGVFYCLHNFPEEVCKKVAPGFLLKLQVYTAASEQVGQKWDTVTFFDKGSRTLYQPWGTPLLPWEFYQPTFNRHKSVFWIGSVWNNFLNQGNIAEIQKLKQALTARNLRFFALHFVPDWLNKILIRQSRLAPAIAGNWQAKNNYLPCRMFKNISYGQLGFSNVRKFDDLYGVCNIRAETIEGLADRALLLSKPDYLDTIRRQQEITKNHTYMNKLMNICKALEIIGQ